MGWLFRTNDTVPVRAAGVSLQTSVYGKPVALVYGTTRVSGNMLFFGNFNSVLVNQGQGGGKGGLFSPSNPSSGQSYNYYATFAFALCEGPIQGIGTVWKDKKLYTLSQVGMTLFTGTYSQAAWGSTVSWSYQDALGNTISGTAAPLTYHGIAYVADGNFQLGNSASIPNMQFEVRGIFSNSVGALPDADPSLILTDILTEVHYGLGFPSARIGDLSNWQNYCLAAGLLVSPAYDTQRTAAEMITELATATNSAPVWSSGTLTMVPYGDQSLTGNGKTYTPPTTPVYSLTDDDFMPDSSGTAGPVTMIRKRPSDKINSIKAEFLDRANNYAPGIAYANDQALIDTYGIRTNGSSQLHLFCNATAANLSVNLQLRRQRISNTYKFSLDARYILLDPMDIVTITDSRLGLNQQGVRITEIQENDDDSLTYTAEEYLAGTGQSPLYTFSLAVPYNSNAATVPASVNQPYIFEPPAALTGSTSKPQIWISASGGTGGVADPNWGGCNVWLSLDNVNYTNMGQIIGASRQGVLTAILPLYTANNPDVTNTLSVNLAESAGVLLSGSALDAQLGHTLCAVDGELLSFQTATLVSGNTYNITSMYRGLFGSQLSTHLVGAQFVRLDNAVFKFDLPAQYINKSVFVKLQSFNVYGGGLQDLATCTVYQFIPTGSSMVNALGQALNVNKVDNGLVVDFPVVTNANYGAITSPIPTGGTPNYFPVTVDLGAFAAAFSLNLVASQTSMLSLTNKNVAMTTCTISFWIKRSVLATQQVVWLSGITGDDLVIQFNGAGNQIQLTSASPTISVTNTGVAMTTTTTWHHVLVAIDTTQITATNRVKIYVDNNSTNLHTTDPTLNSSLGGLIVGASRIGTPNFTLGSVTLGVFLSAEIADFYFVQGQALTPASFATASPGIPIPFTGFTGSRDYFLNFADPNNFGTDHSGENNSFISTNLAPTNQSNDYPS